MIVMIIMAAAALLLLLLEQQNFGISSFYVRIQNKYTNDNSQKVRCNDRIGEIRTVSRPAIRFCLNDLAKDYN